MKMRSLVWMYVKLRLLPGSFLRLSRRGEMFFAQPGADDYRFLELMNADAAAGGPGNLSIIVRSESPQRLTLMEKCLHVTQSKIWGDPMLDASGAATAFREWHVRDFMSRHSRMLGWDQSKRTVLNSELKYWAEQKDRADL
ncbi:hypothetical protein ACFFJ4_21815 [Xanthomonas dyei]|uniref:hypothetical protein n=1 Tax=Xanthomonas dyei TaxID=743699 RepID=UPI0011B05911|nr:hypothetical protein [Xanthomonas dyei]